MNADHKPQAPRSVVSFLSLVLLALAATAAAEPPASVEVRERPELADVPLIVGGDGRGVVLSASYAARRYGVRSGIPTARARRLVPDLLVIPRHYERYAEVSAGVMQIFRSLTAQVEPVSLDEAFLDVTGSLKLFGGPGEIAVRIKEDVLRETGLSASVGVAHNKFLAKLASDAQKPDGLVWVRPAEVRAFLDPMPISRLWGIGKQTAPRLRALGILTIGQLRRADETALQPVLGNRVQHFQALARGEDERPVETSRPDKSISHEVTFDTDRSARAELLAELQRQTEAVARRLRARGPRGSRP